MQNQRLPKIDMAKAESTRSRFNYSHDVNTTCEFGVTQPAMCKLLVPGSKTTLSTESLVRLAPMVAPTFGRIKYKMWHQFIELRDICESFDAMLAEQPIYSPVTKETYVPYQVPWLTLRSASTLAFIGARATFYLRSTASNSNFNTEYLSFDSRNSASRELLFHIVFDAKGNDDIRDCPIGNLPSDSFISTERSHLFLNLGRTGGTYPREGIGGSWSFSGDSGLRVPLGNTYYEGASDYGQLVDLGYRFNNSGVLLNKPVGIDDADFLYNFAADYDGTTYYVTIAFKFSDFGKRIRKILIGMGYQLDLTNNAQVSFLPFLAEYKAYWNLFSLVQWQDWQQTNAAKLIRYLNQPVCLVHVLTQDDDFLSLLVGFIKDFADCFVTDSADFVSSMLPSTAVSPVGNAHFVDVDGSIGIQQVDSAGSVDGTPVTGNGHAYINKINHGYLDEEYLKLLYKWTNRNTIIGRRIAELLRAQGLGKFVDESKSDFIGYSEDIVSITDVVSTADTMPNGGAALGEFGGKGVQYTRGKSFTFENDNFGYWVTLLAIVPESGYSQQLDPTLRAVHKWALYHREFDSKGMDAAMKMDVVAARDTNEYPTDVGSESFGFKPRYYEYKFAQNVCNGDMSLRSTRDVYLPYFLDRFIIQDDKYIVRDSSDIQKFYSKELFNPTKLPTAGNVWRYLTKWSWLGNLKRIFLNFGKRDNYNHVEEFQTENSDWYYYVANHTDDFLVHNIFDMQCYAPMLPVEDSFETTDEDEKPNMSVGKA